MHLEELYCRIYLSFLITAKSAVAWNLNRIALRNIAIGLTVHVRMASENIKSVYIELTQDDY